MMITPNSSDSGSNDDASAIQQMSKSREAKAGSRRLGLKVDESPIPSNNSAGAPGKLSKKAAMWFDQPLFKGFDASSEEEEESQSSGKSKLSAKRKRAEMMQNPRELCKITKTAKMTILSWFLQSLTAKILKAIAMTTRAQITEAWPQLKP